MQSRLFFKYGVDDSQNVVPNSDGTAVASYRGTDIYSGQFSTGTLVIAKLALNQFTQQLTDSSFYYTCCRGSSCVLLRWLSEPSSFR